MNNKSSQNDCSKIEVWSLQPVIDWLFQHGRLIESRYDFVGELSRRLCENGAPIDRLTIAFPTINPLYIATFAVWSSDTGDTIQAQATHDTMQSERYFGSPVQQLRETGLDVRCSIVDLPENSHNAYIELEKEGYTDYYATLIPFNSGLDGSFIVVTKTSNGFSECDLNRFQKIRDFIAPIVEVFSLRHLSSSLMDTYLGKRTGKKVLTGMIKRGDADSIHAALWFSDLREFTRLTENLPAKKVLKMLNDYFEFVAAAVTAHGGEILRFIGDAMLIVFPIDQKVSPQHACQSALDAARDAQQSLAALNHMRRRHGEPEIKFGVGLNVGEVIYGNVGAPDRLDFTVMGPAVNRTSRLESLTKTVGEDILVSAIFVETIDQPMRSMGEHMMKGVDLPQAVFAPTEP